MKNETVDKQVRRIADAIVELVERADGPVTLAQVDREVSGFAAHEPPFCNHVLTGAGGETSFWYDMTEPGVAALRKVMNERKVAIQFVSPVVYWVQGHIFENQNWQPIVLLPVRAANVEAPNWSMRTPPEVAEMITKQGRNRLLKPGLVRATADGFFGVNTDIADNRNRQWV
jgi:hypothetical protein